MPGNKKKLHNHLWLARKRLGLQQKHVAYLLNYKTTDQVSRYEKGLRIPGLRILLQLEIVYGLPARVLYREYYEELRAQVEARAKTVQVISAAYTGLVEEAGLLTAFCVHEELLRSPDLSKTEQVKVRKHVVTLMRRLNELE